MKRLFSIAILFGLSVEVLACNIPVFRYALERWQADAFEITVLYDQLTPEQEALVAELEASSAENNGLANVVVVRSKTPPTRDDDAAQAGLLKVVSRSPNFKLPYLVVRSSAGQGRAIQPWQGTLDEAREIGLLDSPVRKELVRRLQNGHSIVWLMLKSSEERRNQEISQLLKSQCEALDKKIRLPDGIGLPGSELHSEVPLLIKFSYLELDPTDQREAFLVSLFTGIHPESMAAGEPLVVPVFGRGRALEVIPASDVTPELLEDLTLFLGGACSCQVKERNPGFDLLLSTNWDRELFGEHGLRPPPAKTIADRDREPQLLTIPPGRSK